MRPNPPLRRRAPAPWSLLLVALIAFGLGRMARQPAARADSEPGSPYSELGVFAQVLSQVERNYVDVVDSTEILRSAITGLLEPLDPHTRYLSPATYEEAKRGASGEYGGVGLELGVREGVVRVIAALEGTPAHRAGMRPGGRLLAVDGRSVEAMGLLEAVVALRGEPGTVVEVTIPASGDAARGTKTLSLRRERIHVTPVEGRLLPGRIAYLHIKGFENSTFRLALEALDRIEREAAPGRVRGCVIDLRNNPGGLLDQAVKLVDEFLDGGLIVSTEGRRPEETERHYARKGGRIDWPLAVLIDEGSASASEIVAGALQDHGRAVIVGARSFGKGSVQTVVDLADGGALKLTVARYFTPRHRSIHERGIPPDVPVASTVVTSGEDAQLERALEEVARRRSRLQAADQIPER